jgi:glycosyltransferase involved in cell wall biosynthesis
MSEAIAERGHEVHIVTYHFGEDIPVTGPQVHRIPARTDESAVVVGPTRRRPLYDLQMVFKAVEVIRRHRCDLIHAHGYEAALVAWLCRMETGLPFVYSGHCTMADELASYDFIRPRWLAGVLARVLDVFVPRLGDRCIPHSANMVRFFRRLRLGSRTEGVIYKGINLEASAHGDGAAVRRRHGLGQAPVVLYAGVLDEFQRLDLLVEAMAHVARAEPRARLLVVQTIPHAGHLARFRRLLDAHGIAGQVVVTDPQPLAAVPDYLAAGDVAVVPRPRAPGFPIKVVNYLAAGKACVLYASSSGGLTHGDNAYLVSPDTGSALGEAIVEVLRDGELRRRLGENGRAYVRSHRDRRLTAEQVCAVYLRTLERAGRLPAPSRNGVAESDVAADGLAPAGGEQANPATAGRPLWRGFRPQPQALTG